MEGSQKYFQTFNTFRGYPFGISGVPILLGMFLRMNSAFEVSVPRKPLLRLGLWSAAVFK